MFTGRVEMTFRRDLKFIIKLKPHRMCLSGRYDTFTYKVVASTFSDSSALEELACVNTRAATIN